MSSPIPTSNFLNFCWSLLRVTGRLVFTIIFSKVHISTSSSSVHIGTFYRHRPHPIPESSACICASETRSLVNRPPLWTVGARSTTRRRFRNCVRYERRFRLIGSSVAPRRVITATQCHIHIFTAEKAETARKMFITVLARLTFKYVN